MVLRKSEIAYYFLIIWMFLSCFQVYTVSILGSYLPLTSFIMILSISLINFNQFKDVLYIFYTLLFVLTLIYFFKSTEIGLWLYQLFFGFIFIISYSVFKRIDDPEKVFKLLKVFLFSCALNAFLIILFRLYPEVESVFISLLLGFFKNPDRLQGNVGLNVWDVNKSGGVFDNANTAATLHLICFGLVIMLKKHINIIIYCLILALNFFAIIASGSKSAVIILFSSILLVGTICFYYFGNSQYKIIKIFALVIFSIFGLFTLSYFMNKFFSTDFGKNTADTSQDRSNLLNFAYDLFLQNPIQGLGFGGWGVKSDQFGSLYGILPSWPPHNSLVEAWANTGLLGFMLVVSIISILLSRCLQYIKNINIQEGKGLTIALLGAVLMPLGDPQPFLGPVQGAAALGVAFSYCYIHLKRSKLIVKN